MASRTSADNRAKQSPYNPEADEIAHRNERGEIDIDQLNGADLKFRIKNPNMYEGDDVYIVWRGSAADGRPFDQLDAITQVPPGYDPTVGMEASVLNSNIAPFKGGWAFLSYKVNGNDENTPDSLRVHSHLGLREDEASETLAVAQARESHDCEIFVTNLITEGVTLWAPRYQAMQVGDSVELEVRKFNAAGNEVTPPHTVVYQVTETNLAEPLKWAVAKSVFMQARSGQVDVKYSITLAGNKEVLDSPVQSLKVTTQPSVTDYLPKVSIDGFTGLPLDPGMFPAGVTIRVPVYPEIEVGDYMLLYWQPPGQPPGQLTPLVQFARMDVSCLETHEVVFQVDADALVPGEYEVFYQFARMGQALTSESLVVEFKAPRTLLAPSIERASEDGAGRQKLEALTAISGAYVTVPESVALYPGERFEVYWEGYKDVGEQVTDTPVEEGGRRFKIEPSVVAANMHQLNEPESRRVKVFYCIVDEKDVRSTPSSVVDLRVVPTPLNSNMTCVQAESNGDLKQSKLTVNGALLKVESMVGLWPFVATGQLFTIEVEGVAVLRDQVPITDAELSNKLVQQWLSKAVYDEMIDSIQHTVHGRVSFDGGDSWHALTPLRLTPRKSQ